MTGPPIKTPHGGGRRRWKEQRKTETTSAVYTNPQAVHTRARKPAKDATAGVLRAATISRKMSPARTAISVFAGIGYLAAFNLRRLHVL